MVVFDRPVGAQADIKELEYISALHQSGPRLRPDGSIRDEDIKAYLRSRFGIEVSLKEVRKTILQGLGGSDNEGEVIDLMELTAIIIIPLLLKAAAVTKGQQLPPNVVPPPDKLLEMVVGIILHDVTGSEETRQTLTPEFLQRMLTMYGETKMAQDDELIQDMIQHAACASSGGLPVEFNAATFAEGLTSDVQLYDIAHEVRISTSIQDVFHENKSAFVAPVSQADHDGQGTTNFGGGTGCGVTVETLEVQKHAVRQIETLQHIYTAPAIDVQAGTYRSKALTMCLWGTVLFGLFSTAINMNTMDFASDCLDYDSEAGWIDNRDAIGCHLGSSVGGFVLTFLIFSLAGMSSMGMGSLGNYLGHKRWYLPVVGAIFIVCFSFALTTETRDLAYLKYMAYLSRILSCFTAYLHLCHLVTIVFRKIDFETSKWGHRLGFGTLGREVQIKTAGAHKLKILVDNATKVMESQPSSLFKTYFGHGISAYTANGVSTEKSGGVLWLWRSVHDQSIFEREGIWYSTRLVASNFAQLCACFLILILGISVVREVKENFGIEQVKAEVNAVVDGVIETTITNATTISATTELTNSFSAYLTAAEADDLIGVNCSGTSNSSAASSIGDLCIQDELGLYDCSGVQSSQESLCAIIQNPQLAEEDPEAFQQLLQISGFNTSAFETMVKSQLQDAVNESVDSLYPEEEYMLIVPLCIGVCAAILAALRLATLYLPGVTTTILELRSGVIPSLHSPDFQKYREAPDTVTLLTGTLFWGCLVSSILFGGLMAFLVFLFLWQGSFYFMMKLTVTLLGALLVVSLRVFFVMFCCRSAFYKGLYRTKPAKANILLLALEWANFCFSAAFILLRMFKILLIAAASIGQIDRRLLADGVGQVGMFEFDPYPTIHVRDLVAHDAHRHPFIEILGTMYLMKLRHAKHFGSRAGSAWRLLFIYALLPWMHKYRILQKSANFQDLFFMVEASSKLEQETMATTGSDQHALPILDDPTSTDASALEIENEKLKKMLKELSEELEDLREIVSSQKFEI